MSNLVNMLSLAWFSAVLLSAQTPKGTLEGRVTDTPGAAIKVLVFLFVGIELAQMLGLRQMLASRVTWKWKLIRSENSRSNCR
jgi:hypothetical protein